MDDISTISAVVTIVSALISIAFTIGAFLIGRFLWYRKFIRHKPRKVFFPPNDEEFYVYFAKVLSLTKEKVILSGDGFTLSNPKSLKKGNTLDKAILKALENGRQVERFQITSTMSISWLKRLKAIKEKFPENFRVYINPNSESIGSICVIDPGTRHSVYELQVLSKSETGRGTNSAGYQFAHCHQHQTDRAEETLNSAIKAPEAREIKLEDFDSLMEEQWNKKMAMALNDPTYAVIDAEMITALQKGEHKFEIDDFINPQYTNLDCIPRFKS